MFPLPPEADSVGNTWPGGTLQRLLDASVDKRLVVREGGGAASVEVAQIARSTITMASVRKSILI